MPKARSPTRVSKSDFDILLKDNVEIKSIVLRRFLPSFWENAFRVAERNVDARRIAIVDVWRRCVYESPLVMECEYSPLRAQTLTIRRFTSIFIAPKSQTRKSPSSSLVLLTVKVVREQTSWMSSCIVSAYQSLDKAALKSSKDRIPTNGVYAVMRSLTPIRAALSIPRVASITMG